MAFGWQLATCIAKEGRVQDADVFFFYRKPIAVGKHLAAKRANRRRVDGRWSSVGCLWSGV